MTELMLNYSALIGLGGDATNDEVEKRCQDLTEFLSSPDIPEGLRDWAQGHATLIDEALAELLDPDREARQAERTNVVAAAASASSQAVAVKRPPRGHAEKTNVPRHGGARSLGFSSIPRPVFVFVAIAALVFGVYMYGRGGGGGDSSAPAQQAEQQQSDVVPVDEKRVAELRQIILKDPQNVDALFELGESYFLANRFQEALEWETKLLTIDPKNVHVQTDLGTSYFNLGKSAEAKTAWEAGLAVAPDDVQLHYNMGFLFANAEPRDVVSAKKEWQRVLELAPNSELASVVKAHMDTLLATP